MGIPASFSSTRAAAARGGKAGKGALPNEARHLLQHRRLAGSGPALHADHCIARRENVTHGVRLPGGQRRRGKAGRDRLVRAEGVDRRLALPHGLQDAPFRLDRPVGDEGTVRTSQACLSEFPVSDEALDRLVDLVQPVASRRMAQHQCADRVSWDDRASLLEVSHRAGHRLQDARLRFGDAFRRSRGPAPAPRRDSLRRRLDGWTRRRPAATAALVLCQACVRGHRPRHLPARLRIERPRGPQCRLVAGETKGPGAGAPLRHQFRETRLHLAPARVERRLLRRLLRVRQAVLLQVRQDLPAAPGEGVQELRVVARQLETRHRSHHLRRHCHAQRHEPRSQLVAVVRPDQLLIPAQRRRLDALPGAVLRTRHVRQHAVGMKLGIEIPAGEVAEARHHHAVGLHPGTPLRRRIPAPGLQEIPLDPVERRPHRLVVGADDTRIPHHQGFQRHRLRGRKRDVPARAVLPFSLDDAAQPDVALRHLPRQHRLEARRHHVAAKSEVGRRPAVPEARLAVLRVVLRVVPVLLVVRDRRRRGRKFVDGSNHGRLLRRRALRRPGRQRHLRQRGRSRRCVKKPDHEIGHHAEEERAADEKGDGDGVKPEVAAVAPEYLFDVAEPGAERGRALDDVAQRPRLAGLCLSPLGPHAVCLLAQPRDGS